jgi:hypothetical protein
MSSAVWHRGAPVWHVTYSGGMEYWQLGTPEVQLFSAVAFLNATANLVGEAVLSPSSSLLASTSASLDGRAVIAGLPQLLLSPSVSMSGDSETKADAVLLIAARSALEGNAVLFASLSIGNILDAVATLLGSSDQHVIPQLLLSPSVAMSGSSEIEAVAALLFSPQSVLEGSSALTVITSLHMLIRAHLSGDSKLRANLMPITVTSNTRILAGPLVLLDVLADVRGAYPWPAAIRQGKVHSTFTGPVPQYGSLAGSDIIVEVDIPVVNNSQIATIGAMLRGDYGDVFTIEAPRETFQASLVPGNEGAVVEIYPSAPEFTKARAILRFVRVVS